MAPASPTAAAMVSSNIAEGGVQSNAPSAKTKDQQRETDDNQPMVIIAGAFN
jgi:hypothetical protein